MNSAGVDPLYRLHASRLKLLCRTSHYDRAVLQVVAEHCFLPHTMEKVHIFSGPGKSKPQGVDSATTAADSTYQQSSDPQTASATEKVSLDAFFYASLS
jgi:hypothetical protein